MSDDNRLKLKVDLNILKHLGINLYSSVPAVLTEVVANAWDADAVNVSIDIKNNLESIEILDDGFGMSWMDLKDKYLIVGHQKRKDSDTTPSGRLVMGRKGVGKLAPFAIAKNIEIHTTKGEEKTAISLRYSDIEQAAEKGEEYIPEALDDRLCPENHGTRIVLRELNRKRIFVENLAQRLARRFSVIGSGDFKVSINKADGNLREVGFRDRGDLEKLQYIWSIGEWNKPDWLEPQREDVLPSRLDHWCEDWHVKGWIGTARKPKDLSSSAGNLNGIVVLSRGRLFQENILSEVNDGRHYMKYIVGWIEADFLDLTDYDDIATSDRQRVQEDDERYRAISAFLDMALRKIVKDWGRWRVEDQGEALLVQNPVLDEWVGSMPDGAKKHARTMIGKIADLDIEDKSGENTLLRHAIMGFERFRLAEKASDFVEALSVRSVDLIPYLHDVDDIEASLYSDIVKGRLKVIEAFQGKIDGDELEGVLQSYIFDHLWLLDPSWERAQGSEIIEKPVNDEFEKMKAGLSQEEQLGRMDIKYRKSSGEHVIIELKRAGRSVGVQELVNQARKYVRTLKKCLKDRGREHESYQTIFVVGKPLKDEVDPDGMEYIRDSLKTVNGICLTYKQLVDSAYHGYSEYIEARSKKMGKIDRVVKSLES
ncbi:ATP-binding protein [Halomonas sp. MMSF_3323]|uniref:BbrUII/HgiDII family restriction enzyme n=1 Tax=Halomonas sp. MMSF_3323 TaxID=3046701 RepID=UPI00273DE927|nr:ATP-binding protein [Halomonas sp. MMSF_3323]